MPSSTRTDPALCVHCQRYLRPEQEPNQTDHHYVSTACQHSLHGRCRHTCKFCETPCLCTCHSGHPQEPSSELRERPLNDETLEAAMEGAEPYRPGVCGRPELRECLEAALRAVLNTSTTPNQTSRWAVGQRLRHPADGSEWELVEHIGGYEDDWRARCVKASTHSQAVGYRPGHERTFHREYMDRTFGIARQTDHPQGWHYGAIRMGRRWYATRFHPGGPDNDGDLPDVGDTEFWEAGEWHPYSIAVFQGRERDAGLLGQTDHPQEPSSDEADETPRWLCEYCGGSGKDFDWHRYGGVPRQPCPECGGTGQKPSQHPIQEERSDG